MLHMDSDLSPAGHAGVMEPVSFSTVQYHGTIGLFACARRPVSPVPFGPPICLNCCCDRHTPDVLPSFGLIEADGSKLTPHVDGSMKLFFVGCVTSILAQNICETGSTAALGGLRQHFRKS